MIAIISINTRHTSIQTNPTVTGIGMSQRRIGMPTFPICTTGIGTIHIFCRRRGGETEID